MHAMTNTIFLDKSCLQWQRQRLVEEKLFSCFWQGRKNQALHLQKFKTFKCAAGKFLIHPKARDRIKQCTTVHPLASKFSQTVKPVTKVYIPHLLTYAYLSNVYDVSYGNLVTYIDGCKQLGGLVPVFRLGVPLRYKASKLWYALKIPPLYN